MATPNLDNFYRELSEVVSVKTTAEVFAKNVLLNILESKEVKDEHLLKDINYAIKLLGSK